MQETSDESTPRLTRRQMLVTAASIGASAALATLYGCGSGSTTSLPPPPLEAPVPQRPVPPPFVQPEVRNAVNGVLDTTLEVRYANATVNGQTVNVRTYEGAIAGPTLRVRPGDTLRVNIVNALPPNFDESFVYPDHNTPNHPNSTNLHTHGLHVSPLGNSDNVFVEIAPGTSFQYEYQIPANHPAGTYWYHPHKHGSTSVQLFSGMAGAIIIDGALDSFLGLEQVRDLVFLVNELNIDPNTQQVPEYNSPGVFSLNNRQFVVNGQTSPTLTCLPGEIVRLRVINGATRTNLPFGIDQHELVVLSRDGINLPAPQRVSGNIDIPPGGRADVLVQAGALGTYAISKGLDNSANNPDPAVVIAQLVVTGTPVSMQIPLTIATQLPQEPSLPPISADEITGTRTLTFAVSNNGGPPAPHANPPTTFPNFTIATNAGPGQRFDPMRVDQTVSLNAVEEWTLVNTSGVGHPFHIHVNDFQVVEVNGVPLPVPEWRDTIMIPKKSGATNGTVKIRQRFLDFKGLFVLHCHILTHEDIGMMQTVNVV